MNENNDFQFIIQLQYRDLQSTLPTNVKCSDTGKKNVRERNSLYKEHPQDFAFPIVILKAT